MAAISDASFAALEEGVRQAEAALRARQYRVALDQYAALLRVRLSEGGLAAADLIIIERLAELSALFGLFDSAADLLSGMVGLTRCSGNQFATDYTQLKRAELALLRGNLNQTMELLNEMAPRIGNIQAIDLSPHGLARWEAEIAWRNFGLADQRVLFSRAYLILARLLAAFGQYHDARSCIERGLEHSNSPTDNLAYQARLPLLLLRATVWLERGDLDRAATEAASLIEVGGDAPIPAAAVQAIELTARADMLRGKFGPAVERFKEVAELCGDAGLPRAAAVAKLNLAHILILLNRLVEAQADLQEADQIASRIADPAVTLRIGFLLGVVEARRRSSAEAISIGLSVTEMAQPRTQPFAVPGDSPSQQAARVQLLQSDNFLSFFEDRTLELQLALGAGQLAEAEARLRSMAEIFGTTDSPLIRCRLVVLRGMLAYSRGDFGTALDHFDDAAPGLATLGLKPELWQVLDLQGRCAARLGRDTVEHQIVEDSERLLGELMSSLQGPERVAYVLSRASAEERYLAVRVDLLTEMRRAIGGASVWRRPFRRLALLRRLNRLLGTIEQHKTALAERSAGTRRAARQVRRPPSLLWRLMSLPRNRVNLATLVLPDRVVLIRSGFLKLDFGVSAVSRMQLRELVGTWHALMHGEAVSRDLGGAPPPAAPPELSETEVAMALVNALRLDEVLGGLHQRVTRLSLLPDDVLHGLPLAMLPWRGRPLIERFAVSIAFDQRGPWLRSRARGREAVVVGVSRGTANAMPLPNVVPEIDHVAGWLSGRGLEVHRLLDEDAGKTDVLSRLQGAALFHIACHGVFNPDRPDTSGMLLIPNPGAPEMLTIRDLAQAQLQNCQHITLSSCWSADNFLLPGRSIISLPETLARAGAGSVLGCLWPVDDEVAVAFMRRFYRELEKHPRDIALQRVQLACRDSALGVVADAPDPPILADPFFWAGFVLYGEYGRLPRRFRR